MTGVVIILHEPTQPVHMARSFDENNHCLSFIRIFYRKASFSSKECFSSEMAPHSFQADGAAGATFFGRMNSLRTAKPKPKKNSHVGNEFQILAFFATDAWVIHFSYFQSQESLILRNNHQIDH